METDDFVKFLRDEGLNEKNVSIVDRFMPNDVIYYIWFNGTHKTLKLGFITQRLNLNITLNSSKEHLDVFMCTNSKLTFNYTIRVIHRHDGTCEPFSVSLGQFYSFGRADNYADVYPHTHSMEEENGGDDVPDHLLVSGIYSRVIWVNGVPLSPKEYRAANTHTNSQPILSLLTSHSTQVRNQGLKTYAMSLLDMRYGDFSGIVEFINDSYQLPQSMVSVESIMNIAKDAGLDTKVDDLEERLSPVFEADAFGRSTIMHDVIKHGGEGLYLYFQMEDYIYYYNLQNGDCIIHETIY